MHSGRKKEQVPLTCCAPLYSPDRLGSIDLALTKTMVVKSGGEYDLEVEGVAEDTHKTVSQML